MESKSKSKSKSESYKEFDYSLLEGKLCDLKTFERVLKEIKDTNDDFKSLRTIIEPTDIVGVLHFIQYPADGALADKPIVGRIIFPKYYPNKAPVVHIFTRTERMNVDIFNHNCYSLHNLESSVCFDILNKKWNKDYTISALLASLLQAIVSVKVPQIGGNEKIEMVSMEKLFSVNKNIKNTMEKYMKYMPSERIIEKTNGFKINSKKFIFEKDKFSTYYKQELCLNSNKFKLKDGPFSIGIDLEDLVNNPSTVFSVILTNNENDLIGKNEDTILFRNGVTGTAASKYANKPMNWFYHGVPLNSTKIKLVVTITEKQFIICYKIDDSDWYIHGDYPISYFDKSEIQSVNFKLCLYLKNKNKGVPVCIKLFDNDGYIQEETLEELQIDKLTL